MKELTDAARKNLAAGAEHGAGTLVCSGCFGPKSESRINSTKCTACGRRIKPPKVPARLVRTDLPEDVWDRLNAEATEKGLTIGVYLKRLIIARDARRQEKDQ